MTPTSSVRRFELRLRLYTLLLRAVRSVDGSDLLTVAALGLIGAGITLALWGAVVVGALVLTATPVGTSLRIFIRGK